VTTPASASTSTQSVTSQRVGITAVNPAGGTATGQGRLSASIAINLNYYPGATYVVPAVGEQWYIKKISGQWVLDFKLPFLQTTQGLVIQNPVQGTYQLGSSGTVQGPLLLDGSVINAQAPLSLNAYPTASLPSAATAGAGALVWDSTVAAVKISNGTIWDLVPSGLITSADVDSSIIIAAGTNPFTGPQSMGNNKLTSVATPTVSTDAATKGYVDAGGANFNLSGVRASLPAAGSAGRVYYCTDCDAIYRDNGTAWAKIRIGDSAGPPMADPPTAGWTASNMLTGSSWASSLDGMLFTTSTSQTGIGFQYRTYPTPPFVLTTYLDASYSTFFGMPTSASSAFFCGIIVSDGTKFIIHGPTSVNSPATAPWADSDGWYAGASFWSSTTSPSSFYNGDLTPQVFIGKMPKWFRYTDNGTNRIMDCSANGIDWLPIANETRTTNVTPTRIGIGTIQTGTPSASGILRVRSWNGVS
jgi:hypothetical protein